MADRLCVIVSRGDPEVIAEAASVCRAAAAQGAAVRVFFRDESIPALCPASTADQLTGAPGHPESAAALEDLVRAGDVRLYACSSSLYLWGIGSQDLVPALASSRGLIAFLAEDLAEADEVISF